MASLARDTNGPVLAYLLLSQAAVQVAGPYFTPFMLGHLALGYYRYVVLVCAALLARIVLLPAWGRVVERCRGRIGSCGSAPSASSPCPPCGSSRGRSPC